MKKRGKIAQSNIIVTVILILVALAAVVFIGIFIRNQVKSGTSEDVNAVALTVALDIREAGLVNNLFTASINRPAGKGNLSSLRFTLKNATESYIWTENNPNLNELETKTYSLNLVGKITNPDIVYVLPFFGTKNGVEVSKKIVVSDSCIPNCACASSVPIGQSCTDSVCGTSCAGQKIIFFAVTPTVGAGLETRINLATNFTIAWWQYGKNTAGVRKIISDVIQGNEIGIFWNNQKLYFYTGGGEYNWFDFNSISISNNKWNRFVVTRYGDKADIFFNGVAAGDGYPMTFLGTFNSSIGSILGQYSDGSNSPNYAIDELVILNTTKDISWALADYNNGAGKYYTNLDSNVIAVYHFDEGQGSMAVDTIKGNNATFISAPNWVASNVSMH
jgi:hypothetical protein